MKFYLLLLLLFLTMPAFAQISISGNVSADNAAALQSVTVKFFKRDVLIGSTVTDNKGDFVFKNLKAGTFRLLLTHIGYRPVDTTFYPSTPIEMKFRLLADTGRIKDVTITSRKALFEKKIDRISYIVGGRSTYDNKSVTDILKSIPSLNVTPSSIEIRGKGPAVVMIDEHVIYLSNRDLIQYLSIYKDDIESVEIIPNPPAKYDAQGSALINIVTKKHRVPGWFGSVETAVTKTTYLENDETADFGYRNKNFSLLASGGGSFGAYQENVSNSNNLLNVGQSWLDKAINKNVFQDGRFNLVTELLLSKRSKLYASYSFVSAHNTDNEHHWLDYSSSGTSDSTGTTTGKDHTNGTTNLLSLGLSAGLGKKKNTLDASIDYAGKTNLQTTNTQTINYFGGSGASTGNLFGLYSYGDIPKNVFSAKTDLVFTTLLPSWNVETGAKFTLFNNNSQTDYDEDVNGISIFNNIATRDTFNYREQDMAGYVSLDRTYKSWHTKLGLRYEETWTSETPAANAAPHKFGYLFPSLFLQYTLGDGSTADVSYTRRIVRPTLFDLNPFRFYTSILSYYQGNPFLEPSIQHNFDLNFNLKSMFLFTAYYNITYSPIVSFPYSSGDVVETVKQNSGTNQNYGINIDAMLNPASWMQSNFGLAIGSYHYSTTYLYSLNGTPLNVTLSSSNSFQLSGTLSIDAGFSATLPGGALNISKQKGYSSLDLGATKTLCKNKLALTLSAGDILRSNVQGSSTNTPSFTSVNANYYDFRQVMLSVRYKFGKELKTVKKRSNSPDVNRIR